MLFGKIQGDEAERPIDRKAAIQAGIIHERNFESDFDRLQGFYGRVSQKQNELIVNNVAGTRVLDVGAGYGNLTKQLRHAGLDVVAIELDEEKIWRARNWFGVEMVHGDFLSLHFEEATFDTVIFREVINHFELAPALEKAFALTRNRCLLFQGTEILPVRLAKKWYRHEEYRQVTPESLVAGLVQAGFVVKKTLYTDVAAFPASGGYLGRCWIPRVEWCYSPLLSLDALLNRGVNMLGLGRHLCFRMLITADKPAT